MRKKSKTSQPLDLEAGDPVFPGVVHMLACGPSQRGSSWQTVTKHQCPLKVAPRGATAKPQEGGRDPETAPYPARDLREAVRCSEAQRLPETSQRDL